VLVTIRREHRVGGFDPEVVWRRRPASLRPALRRVEDTLVDALTAWAREHWPDEPAYCLAISYRPDHPLHVDAGIGTDRERQAMLLEPGEYGVGLELWNPAEFEAHPGFSPSRAHVERHLRACAPKAIFADLKKRGLFYVEP
jgi:hypothetical protein